MNLSYLVQAQEASGSSPGTLSYLLADRLGSTVGVMDASGAVTGTQTYWPYGAPRSATGVLAGAAPTDRQYTGQQQQPPQSDALGLYNYKARFYSTLLGRFTSVDPIVADVYDPQAWNGSTYVENNPLGRTDPPGERLICYPEPCESAAAGASRLSHRPPRAGGSRDGYHARRCRLCKRARARRRRYGDADLALQATRLHLPKQRDLRRPAGRVGLRPARRRDEAQREGRLVAGQCPRAR
jgi:RHS repeat-associated protein